MKGEEGLSAADLPTLAEERAEPPPRGHVDVGRMLARPKDIVLDLRGIERLDGEEDADSIPRSLLGEYYTGSMKPSPLPRRLLRMKGEIDRHEGELRYLFWLNGRARTALDRPRGVASSRGTPRPRRVRFPVRGRPRAQNRSRR